MAISLEVVKGVKWTSISTFGRALIQLAQLSLVAHYLSAEALGLYALVQICLAFSQLFMDMGIGNAIIHHSENSHKNLSELFLINIFIALILSCCVYFLAPLVASFFEQKSLSSYIQLVSIVFVVFAASRIHLALLQKQLFFSIIAKVELVSAILGFTIVVLLILNNYGIESLLYGYLSTAAIQSILFWFVSDFRPKFCIPNSWLEIKKYLSFGLYQTGDATVNYFNSQFDLILVGKLLGVEVLGGYALARQFCFRPAMIINPVFTRVAFPVMAKLQHNDNLPKFYCKLLNTLSLLNFPLYVAMIVLAEPIVFVFFGEQWLHIVSIFQLLAVWCLVRSTMNPVGSLLMAIGKVKLALKWNVFLLFVIPPIIYFSASYSIYSVALSLAILQILLLPGHWFFLLKRSVGILFSDLMKAQFKPLLSASLSGVFTWLVLATLVEWSILLQLSVGLSLFGISYTMFAYFLCPLFKSFLKGNYSFD